MALSDKTKAYLKYSLTSQDVTDEVVAALNTASDVPAEISAGIAAHVALPDPHSQYLKKGSVVWCLPGGQYATLQAAIDAASAGQTILLGEGSWGNATLKSGVNIVGLDAPRGLHCSVGQLSYAPTSGDANTNSVFLSNLFISASSSASAVSFGGTAPARLNLEGCYVFRGSGSNNVISLTNTDATATTFRLTNCFINSSASTGVLLSSSVRYARIYQCEFNGAGKAVVVGAGLTQTSLCSFETNSATEIIQVSAGSYEAASTSLIRNLTAGGSGCSVAAGGTLILSSGCIFDVATGGGYAVKGAGTVVYDFVSFSHIPVVNPRNTIFQNTLTVVAWPTAPTSAP